MARNHNRNRIQGIGGTNSPKRPRETKYRGHLAVCHHCSSGNGSECSPNSLLKGRPSYRDWNLIEGTIFTVQIRTDAATKATGIIALLQANTAIARVQQIHHTLFIANIVERTQALTISNEQNCS